MGQLLNLMELITTATVLIEKTYSWMCDSQGLITKSLLIGLHERPIFG